MSRIAGLLLPAPPAERAALLSAMLVASRSSVRWQEARVPAGSVALGWSGARTPEVAVVGEVAVVLDGTIYNRAELAATLGAGAAEEADAALLARLHARHGFEEALGKLNGDFAVALHDGRDGTLWLARDRFGVKPLYYIADGDRVAFASRPRALLALPRVSRDADPAWVARFAGLHYRYIDNDLARSAYAAIAQLPAAHLACVRNGRVVTRRWWSIEDRPDFDAPEAVLAERYRELLIDAVTLRLARASSPAFTLSGGMDSSSVLAAAVRASGARQHAFSTVYADKTYDESDEIRSMLATTVARWHPVAVGTPDVFALVRRMIDAHDEPVATATWLSHHVLCEQVAALGFGAVFGGLGGDELNAGEYEHFLYFFADLRAAGDEARLAREIDAWALHHDHPVFRKSRQTAERDLARLIDATVPGRCRPDRTRLLRYAGALVPELFDLASFEPVMEHPFASHLKNRTWQDISRETLPPCLRAEDRQATAAGLDHLLPFLDHRLVELMFRIPGTLKVRDGVTKILLREATRGLLPEETRTRIKKTGWNAPAHLWFSGAGHAQLHDLVRSRHFREGGIYDADAVVRIVDDHDRIVASGQPAENHMMFLWQLVNLELWLESL